MRIYIVFAQAYNAETKLYKSKLVRNVFFSRASAEEFINDNKSCPREYSVGGFNYTIDYFIEDYEVLK
jgi:hypothetical protein